eukprot:6097686-Alexandrium_andersonii.AAC.1
MSASLVGSEMCIRDRHKGGGRAEHSPRGPRHSLQRGPGEAVPHPPGAVSYTHLTLPTICSV